jgi:hypothetical protein
MTRLFRHPLAAALAVGLTASVFGQASFTDVGVSSGTQVLCNTHGSGFFDFNGDGWDDIYVVHNYSTGQTDIDHSLLRSNGNGTFTNVTRVSGTQGYPHSSAQGLAAADFDNDGDTDMAVAMGQYNRILFYENRGNGTFGDAERVYDPHGMTYRSRNHAFIDIDNDGFVDLFATRDTNPENLAYDPRFLVFMNNRQGGFVERTREAGLWDYKPTSENKYGFAAADVDNDGFVDVYAPGYDSPSLFLYNNGNGTFSERTAARGLPRDSLCLGAIFLDYDNDGHWDLFLKHEPADNRGNVFGRLFRNDGDGTFTDVTVDAGVGFNLGWYHLDNVFGGGLTAADFDNDGWTDILSVNEWGGDCALLRNWGNGKFANLAYRAGIEEGAYRWYWSAPVADYNHDGYVDIYMGRSLNPFVPAQFASLYRNTGGTLNWIQFRLTGVQSNRSAVGARLEVFSAGRRQMRQILGGEGYKVNSFTVHFGLGSEARVDTLIVHWPSGAVQKIMGIPAGLFYDVRERDGVQYFGDLAVSGTIRHAGSGRPVPGTDVRRDGAAVSVLSDGTGAYAYRPILYNEPALVLRPGKTAGTSVEDGILTAYDAALMLRHAAGSPIPAALQAAADADGNGTINGLDATAVARASAGLAPAAGSRLAEWRFSPLTRSYSNVIQSVTGQDYTASLSGDASGNWGADPAYGTPGGIAPDAIAVYRNTVTFDVTLNVPALQNAWSADIRLEYDPSILGFVQADKAASISDFNLVTNGATAGRLAFALYGTRSLSPGSAFLTLKFRMLQFPETGKAIEWTRLAFNEVRYGTATTTVNGVDLTVSGSVTYAGTFFGVAGAVIGSGGLLNPDAETDSSGAFRTAWIPYGASNLVLRPSKSAGEDIPEGSVNAFDAACILRHAAGTAVLPTPLQAAADVNGDGRIDTTDAALVAAFSAGRTSESGSAIGEWRFTPDSRTFSAVTHVVTGQDFEAVIAGDASGDGWRMADTTDVEGVFPDSIVAERDRDTVVIPVGTSGRTDLSSANCTFEYDTTAMAFASVNRPGDGDSVRLLATESIRGRVSVVLYAADPVSASGNVFSLTFRMARYPIPPTAVEWTSLTLNENPARCGRTVLYGLDLSIQGRARYAGTGEPIAGVSVEARGPMADTVRTDAAGFYQLAPLPYGVSGLEVRPSRPSWEGVGAAVVTALDAAEVMRHLSGDALPAERQAAADADGNGRIEQADAAVIAGWIVGSINSGAVPLGGWRFIPESRVYPDLVRSFDSEDFTAIVIGDASGNWNRFADSLDAAGLFPDTLTADSADTFVDAALSAPAGFAFRSAGLEVRYDTSAVSFVEVRKADPADPLVLAFREPEKGRVRAALFSGQAQERSGSLVILRFEPKSRDTELFGLEWAGLSFDDRPVAGGITRVNIERPDTTSHDTTAVRQDRDIGPSVFGLSGVYPNPFNPVVTIVYTMDKSGPVSIRIMDVYGREAAVLFEGRKSAGDFQVQWDGKDGSGMEAPSGLYVIRMTAGDRTSYRKALKIK